MKYLLLLLPIFSFAQKEVYKAPDFKQEIKLQKTVAIIPLRVTISYKKLPKGVSAADNQAQEKEQGVNMQQGMYTYLLRKSNDYTVTFQDVEITNAILKKNGIDLDYLIPDSLCKILGVDAVIVSSYAYERTASEAGVIVRSLFSTFAGSTGSGALTMQVYTGNKLLWRFYKEMNEKSFGSANELMERMMKKVARNFPYEK